MSCEHEIKLIVAPTDEACKFHIDVSAYKDRIVAPDEYSGATEVTPSDSEQVLPTTDKLVRDDITVNPAPTEILSTDHNGTFVPSEGNVGFSQVNIDVQPDLRPLSVSENGSYRPDGFDGYESVRVNVQNTGYYTPKMDDGKAHIWLNIPEKFRDIQIYMYLDKTVISVDWGDGSDPDVYDAVSGSVINGAISHEYASAGFYDVSISTIKEPPSDKKWQKAFGSGSGDSTLIGGATYPRRLYMSCLIGFESSNFSIRTSQILHGARCDNVYLEDCVSNMGNQYYQSGGIKYIEMPSGATSIGTSCLQGNSLLDNVRIPANITSIGANAFQDTYRIRIHMESAIPPELSSVAFSGYCTPTIYVPAESLEAYKTATNWSNYADSIFEEPTA